MDNHEYYMQIDLEPYLGKWITICQEQVVSSGDDAEKVYEEAKKKFPNERILFTLVPDGEMFF